MSIIKNEAKGTEELRLDLTRTTPESFSLTLFFTLSHSFFKLFHIII